MAWKGTVEERYDLDGDISEKAMMCLLYESRFVQNISSLWNRFFCLLDGYCK